MTAPTKSRTSAATIDTTMKPVRLAGLIHRSRGARGGAANAYGRGGPYDGGPYGDGPGPGGAGGSASVAAGSGAACAPAWCSGSDPVGSVMMSPSCVIVRLNLWGVLSFCLVSAVIHSSVIRTDS